MSNILILKVEDEDINEEEGIAVIQNIAEQFGLRVMIHGGLEDEGDRYDLLASLDDMHESDLLKNLAAGQLLPLVDEEHGIIGYVIDGQPTQELMNALNGYPTE